MYQVIARKYRPQTFSDLVAQEHVRTTLENAISQNRIAHGYIFSGQRGTGKTTVARILARCLNCVEGPTVTPCGKCASCLEITAGNTVDVIEIDAASNRGINEMRELRENVRYRPARDRYKVFIIDEAHQITNEAFNALLKTLEEPPDWVVFVLCTTESHKIPATISSRCQSFSFRSVSYDEIVTRMDWICRQEGVEADSEVLAVLAQAGEGSVRDSFSALDQAIACCGNKLSAAEVRSLVGAFSLDSLHRVTQALKEGSAPRMLELVDDLVRNGQHLQHFCRELSRYFRNLLVTKIAGPDTKLVATSGTERQQLAEIAAGFSEEDLTRYLQLTLELFRDLQLSLQPRLHMEMGLLRLVHAGRLLPIEEALAGVGTAGPAAPPASSPAPRRSGGAPSGPSRQAAPGAEALAGAVPAGAQRQAAAPFSSQPAPAADAPKPPAAAQAGGLKERLYAAFTEMGMTFTADAVESSQLTEAGNELQFVTPEEFSLALGQAEVRKALEHIGEPPRRVKITIGKPAAGTAEVKRRTDDETTRRALEHPAVQRFRETFPDAEIRNVRDLRN